MTSPAAWSAHRSTCLLHSSMLTIIVERIMYVVLLGCGGHRSDR